MISRNLTTLAASLMLFSATTMAAPSIGIEAELSTSVKSIRAKLPVKMSEGVTWSDITSYGRTLVYVYQMDVTILDLRTERQQKLFNQLTYLGALRDYCKAPADPLRDLGVESVFSYWSQQDGSMIGSFTLQKQSCDKLSENGNVAKTKPWEQRKIVPTL